VGTLSQINTMKLTSEQIKQNGLAMIAFIGGEPIQEYNTFNHDNGWYDISSPDFSEPGYVWRPKPQPVSRPWSKPQDVPLNCWLNAPSFNNQAWFVNGVMESGLYSAGGLKTWSELRDYRYSTDRVTWKPCTVEDAP